MYINRLYGLKEGLKEQIKSNFDIYLKIEKNEIFKNRK